MKSLEQYITSRENLIDSHIHLFDHSGIIKPQYIRDQKCVCFIDIAFRYLEEYKDHRIIDMYDDFIKNYYDPKKHILLATADNAEDTIAIYNKYSEYIKGFGELKCYDSWKEGELPYGNLDWIKPILDFNIDKNLPVYIHFNMDSIDHRKQLEDILSRYHFPIVLCHCGFVDDDYLNLDIYNFVQQIMKIYSNLYIDISTIKTRKFFIDNPNKLLNLDCNRLIVGSDLNPIIDQVIQKPIEFSNLCYDQVDKLMRVVKSTKNTERLFNITHTYIDNLIEKYQQQYSNYDRHSRIHILTRGSLIGMFSPKEIKKELKYNAHTLQNILDLFDNDNRRIIDEYVSIGYTKDTRKQKILELFKKVDVEYERFLCIITILEMTYTFKRMDLVDMINIKHIESIISNNIDLIQKCIDEDKYNFIQKASTKYINAIFFIHNLKDLFNPLNSIHIDFNKIIQYFINLYKWNPSTTTIYGITHILIGASNFYTKCIDSKFKPLTDIIFQLCNSKDFNNLPLDLRIELLLCCKLFSYPIRIDLRSLINDVKLQKNEHTNMLFILLNKYNIC